MMRTYLPTGKDLSRMRWEDRDENIRSRRILIAAQGHLFYPYDPEIDALRHAGRDIPPYNIPADALALIQLYSQLAQLADDIRREIECSASEMDEIFAGSTV